MKYLVTISYSDIYILFVCDFQQAPTECTVGGAAGSTAVRPSLEEGEDGKGGPRT